MSKITKDIVLKITINKNLAVGWAEKLIFSFEVNEDMYINKINIPPIKTKNKT